ncbi:MAG: DUF5078 domain-containing protein [Mycobacterium sp.]|nr:DUF5078 domain-containing protein [Mycobacterium sp.]
MTSALTSARILSAAALAGAFALGSLGSAAVAAADNTVPPSMLNTTCSLDQIMAATKVVDPITYGELIGKYNSEPRWVQGGIVYHMNLLLSKPPQERQAEVNELVGIFPQYVSLFTGAEPQASQIAAKCPTFPAEDPAVWIATAPAPAPVTAPLPAAPQPATAVAPGA